MLTFEDVLGKNVRVREGFVQKGDGIRKVKGVTGIVINGYTAHTINRENPKDKGRTLTFLIIALDDKSLDDEGTAECTTEDVELIIKRTD